MMKSGYQSQSAFARSYVAEGRQEGRQEGRDEGLREGALRAKEPCAWVLACSLSQPACSGRSDSGHRNRTAWPITSRHSRLNNPAGNWP
ncbi:Hypothetical protein CAP_1617 [Chondromyces apiculatus DSM 436]|uniref:Essential protein Yae1 N-terminal domain-containing protein n=1 Tax=Chondromyces apiculatus DSM 436 TaxID=1192034 RepID=A0A017SSU0_9BACT|nr:Hypothetical protein CAP_1617 [Chondromyces apiculatus DSM 436]